MKCSILFSTLAAISFVVGCSHKNVKRDIASDKYYVCGAKGSIQERIKDCSGEADSVRGSFVLVSKNNYSYSVYKDMRSNLLWSSKLYSIGLTYGQAIEACKLKFYNFNEKEAHYTQYGEMGGINAKWRLPTIEEVREAYANGLKESKPYGGYDFWSSTIKKDDEEFGWVYSGDGKIFPIYLRGYLSARCVVEDK